MKTINDFIEELRHISPDKRNLPLVTYCPNGLEVEPVIKMEWNDKYEMLDNPPDKMVVTWNN